MENAMLTVETIDAISDLAVQARVPRVLDSPDPRLLAYALRGGVEFLEKPTPARGHKVYSLADLIDFAEYFAGGDGGDDEPEGDAPEADAKPEAGCCKDGESCGGDCPFPNGCAQRLGDLLESDATPTVYFAEDQVVLVLDDEAHRVDTVTLPLPHSSAYATLAKLDAEKPWLDQKAFIRLLRIDLAGMHDPYELLNRVRKIVWKSSIDSEIRKDRESLGRDIVAAASDGSDLPEEIDLSIPIWKAAGELNDRYTVTCSVEVDADARKFRLVPLPDRLNRAVQEAVASIRDRLDAGLPASVPAYHGRP